jgi:dipeptidyl aminopeptidase/acylaminoacyl peptidase
MLRLLPLALLVAACASDPTAHTAYTPEGGYDASRDSLRMTGEVHLRNIRQLTFGGNNAEAYWSYDDEQLVFQSDWDAINPQGCDQQFVLRVADRFAPGDTSAYTLASTGTGRTTCGYFTPEGRVVYASTHAADPACPTPPQSASGRYVWPIYDTFDIYESDPDGQNRTLLVGGAGYDAEATLSPDGRYVLFTSTRSGDLELWRLDRQTGDLLQLTDTPGYDGGAFFSPDGSQIVWRASRPVGAEAERYFELLGQGVVEPSDMNLFVADADGSNARQITDLPGANWAPFFHPSGEKILFSSNHHSDGGRGRAFALFLIGVDGTGLTQVSHSGIFDAFPMFSFAGDRLVFASNRNLSRTPSRETNVFVADWVERPTAADSAFVSLVPEPDQMARPQRPGTRTTDS